LNCKSVLIHGVAYGRNAKPFVEAGMSVTGIEISEKAIEIAKQNHFSICIITGSVLEIPLESTLYDAIFCFHLVHLFFKNDRIKLIEKFKNQVKIDGYTFVVIMPELEETFGKGVEIEENTYEQKKGKPVHFFTESDLLTHFREFEILDHGIIEEPENHGFEHVHKYRYIFIKKRNK